MTYFTNGLDPVPRSRQVFNFPRPETLTEWMAQPAQLRSRVRDLPPLDETRLWRVQTKAIRNLESSFNRADPRALIQMATGSGKTFTAVNVGYRLLKFANAKRILFLVDRGNLGKQTEDEFANFEPADDPRKFPTLYTVQRLKTNSINPAAKVVITTIQRLYSMLKGEAEFDADNEEDSAFDTAGPWQGAPPDVVYNAGIPPEFFDFIIVDECHRSIYELWSQVLLYFDAFIVGLTATPAGKTIGFFNQNLVMQYGHDEAVTDGVNVDFDVYRIRTRITEQGATIVAGDTGVYVDKRQKLTRRERLEFLNMPEYGLTPASRTPISDQPGRPTRSKAPSGGLCPSVAPIDRRWRQADRFGDTQAGRVADGQDGAMLPAVDDAVRENARKRAATSPARSPRRAKSRRIARSRRRSTTSPSHAAISRFTCSAARDRGKSASRQPAPGRRFLDQNQRSRRA